jgi:hypothetical protein
MPSWNDNVEYLSHPRFFGDPVRGNEIVVFVAFIIGLFGSPLLALGVLMLRRPKGWSVLKWLLTLTWLSAAISSFTTFLFGPFVFMYFLPYILGLTATASVVVLLIAAIIARVTKEPLRWNKQ